MKLFIVYGICFFIDKVKASTFTDHDVHNYLRKNNFLNPRGEWFKCNVDDVKIAINAIKSGHLCMQGRLNSFQMRPEQIAAVEKTCNYFNYCKNGEGFYFAFLL